MSSLVRDMKGPAIFRFENCWTKFQGYTRVVEDIRDDREGSRTLEDVSEKLLISSRELKRWSKQHCPNNG